MIFAIDFDGTIVAQDHPYNDIVTPLAFLPGAREALLALREGHHTLLLWSGRASRALLYDPMLCPLARVGARYINREWWEESRDLNWARYWQMVEFIDQELPGVFHAIDDGAAGKPSADMFIDDRAMRLISSSAREVWGRIAKWYGADDEERDL